ncbi:MAG: hypothetical protein O3B90_07115 [Actinomycetota bacterium]|uniref:hypothetical protein n=1 Tax=uncultured Ilumatobacter sp. TaxID=879968 RepID=UPI00374E4412|nr:hypothetical protein [Actinomycetota bacterium]
MVGENRRVAADSSAHAQGLTDNLTKQGFALESQSAGEWTLRKERRRGDHVVTIAISQPSVIQQPNLVTPPTSGSSASANWAPPKF